MKSFRLTLRYVRHNLMSAMAYRTAFILQVFGMLLNDVMLLFFWTILFSRFPSLNGWGLRDVVTLYGLVALSFGLATGVCGNSGRVAHIIANGELDYYLTLPVDPSNSDPFDGSAGLDVRVINVPDGALLLRADTNSFQAPDVDLFVGQDLNGNGQAEQDELIERALQ